MRTTDPVVVYCIEITMYNFTGEVIVMTDASNRALEHDFSTVWIYREIEREREREGERGRERERESIGCVIQILLVSVINNRYGLDLWSFVSYL